MPHEEHADTQGMVCWMPFIHSSGIWFANRIIMGILVSPIEMLVEISIADIVSRFLQPR